MTTVQYKVILGILLVNVLQAYSQNFIDTPPDDYYNRKTFSDCETRFYNGKYRTLFAAGHGGYRAIQKEFQHMVAIGWTDSDGSVKYLCGGVLISTEFAVTAAHCQFNSNNKAPDTVRLGDTNLGGEEDDDLAQQIGIKRLIPHPLYRLSKRYYDIALIELKQPAEITDAICPVCVWLENYVPKDTLDVVGFGALGFGEPLSDTLQKLRLNFISQDDCEAKIPSSRRQWPNGLSNDQFCASSPTMDTCEGDSGGPIQVERLDDFGYITPLVIGLVSFGTPCTNGSTGVYTRIAPYIEWIEQQTGLQLDYTTCVRNSTCPSRVPTSNPFATLNEYIYFRLGLLWNADGADQFDCGGTLIDYQYVLTAASCVTTSKGEPKFVKTTDDEIVPVANVFVHPNFIYGQPANDIALLKLTKFVNVKELQPMCLWANQTFTNEDDPTFLNHLPGFIPKIASRFIKPITRSWTRKCDSKAFDVECFLNNIPLVPTICQVDHGGPVFKRQVLRARTAPHMFGVVSNINTDCSSNLHMTSIYPHIPWMESIVFNHLTERLIFSP